MLLVESKLLRYWNVLCPPLPPCFIILKIALLKYNGQTINCIYLKYTI